MEKYKRIAIAVFLTAIILSAWHGIEIYLCGDSQISLVDVVIAVLTASWIMFYPYRREYLVWMVVFTAIMMSIKLAWFGVETVICDYSLTSEIDFLFSALFAIVITDIFLPVRTGTIYKQLLYKEPK